MPYDIHGNNLRNGFCEVHPYVEQEYPCQICYQEIEREEQRQRENREHSQLQNEQYHLQTALQQQHIEKLEADKAELLEALEKVKRLEPIICMGGAVAEQWQNEDQALNEMMAEIESLIQKMKQCQENTPR